ncbi:lipopolysaccharide assembly protein LapB [Marinobacterium mangrovicola]|uniref:Lipopolysaccharide assembly protein B n=1 Tax=Marinobacterium mangrovicola TaxID=1476959 RepID=A0A4R1G968_9GAMM|nr:lipopolysaccharide assembly protein LapB [Marinobacterium mangrovicola]TCK03035.1 lipopolysaccharide biosynthesis regulator YciM [Marinobacterium mangrovicola]
MSFDPLLLLLLVAAIGIGWFLGRRSRQSDASRGSETRQDGALSREYFQGLNYLMSDRTDEAIESFIRALEINSDTIPAHLAVARLLRRKGDVDRAIRVHQTLLARPGLEHTDFIRIQMALARDYEAIGLLDRAENLLHEIIRDNPGAEMKSNALELLVKLYEKEAEWSDALRMGRQLEAEGQGRIGRELAQYCCELAENSLARKRWKEVQTGLAEALRFNPSGVRPNLLGARMAMERSQWPLAIKRLRSVREQEPLLVSETIPLLARCYKEVNRLDQFESYLEECMVHAPSTTVLLARTDLLCEREGVRAAGQFITDELKSRPSIRGFNRLIDLHLEYGSSSARESLTVLRGLTGQLELSKPIYRCGHCGFAGRTLHWHCPSCRQWDSTRPIQGLEGE